MPLLQRHIAIKLGDFSRILNILNVISSIILLQHTSYNNAKNIRQTKNEHLVTLAISDRVGFNFCDKLSIMLYLCTTLKLYVLFSGNVDNDAVLIWTVVKNGGVLKLHTE